MCKCAHFLSNSLTYFTKQTCPSIPRNIDTWQGVPFGERGLGVRVTFKSFKLIASYPQSLDFKLSIKTSPCLRDMAGNKMHLGQARWILSLVHCMFPQRSASYTSGAVSSTPPTFAAHGSSSWPPRTAVQEHQHLVSKMAHIVKDEIIYYLTLLYLVHAYQKYNIKLDVSLCIKALESILNCS